MKVFLIIVAVLAVLIIAICNLSATITLIYDKGWTTQLQVLFIKKDIVLSEILSFLLFPEKKAQEVIDNKQAEKSNDNDVPADKAKEKSAALKKDNTNNSKQKTDKSKTVAKEAEKITKAEKLEDEEILEALKKIEQEQNNKAPEKEENSQPAKSNPISKMIEKDGITGVLTLVADLLHTANAAVTTLIKGLHIYSLYVMIIVGGWDAADIGETYGLLCSIYYPIKGALLNQLKIDNYDDYIQPDFLAEHNEYEFQLIASISVGLLLKVGIKAVKVFLQNLIKDNKIKKAAAKRAAQQTK